MGELVPLWRVSKTPGSLYVTSGGEETLGVSGERLVDIEIGNYYRSSIIPYKQYRRAANFVS